MNPFRAPSWPDAPADLDTAAPVEAERGECWWIGPALIIAGVIGLALIPVLQ